MPIIFDVTKRAPVAPARNLSIVMDRTDSADGCLRMAGGNVHELARGKRPYHRRTAEKRDEFASMGGSSIKLNLTQPQLAS